MKASERLRTAVDRYWRPRGRKGSPNRLSKEMEKLNADRGVKILGSSRGSVYNYYRGDQEPPAEFLEATADIIGKAVRREWLVEGAGAPTPVEEEAPKSEAPDRQNGLPTFHDLILEGFPELNEFYPPTRDQMFGFLYDLAVRENARAQQEDVEPEWLTERSRWLRDSLYRPLNRFESRLLDLHQRERPMERYTQAMIMALRLALDDEGE